MAYCPNKNLEEWKLLVSSRGEIMAYYLWDKYEGNVPEIESKQFQKLTQEEKAKTIEQVTKEHRSITALKDLAAKLAHRIGGKVIFENNPNADWKGYNQGNTSVLNEAYMTPDTPFHEILAHPIIRALKYSKKIGGTINLDGTLDKSTAKAEFSKIYQNLLKELETGRGKEVFEQVKRDYKYKNEKIVADYSDIRLQKEGAYKGYYSIYINGIYWGNEKTLEEAKDTIDRLNKENEYTLEEQQEEAIVELLGLMTAEKLDNVKDGKLISLLKRLLKEMKAFIRSLIGQKEVEIDKLPDNMTLGDLSDLLAYSNSKLILPGYEVEYTTPDNIKFKTYQEASNHISKLFSESKDVDLSDVKLNRDLSKEELDKIQELTDLKNKEEDFLKSKEYQDGKQKKLKELNEKLKNLENKEVKFYSQEPSLDLEDKKKYGFQDFDYIRVESSYSRKSSPFGETLWQKHFGKDFEGYYIHGYNTDKTKPATKVLKITKEEAKAIWEKEKEKNPSWSLEVADQQEIYRTKDEIRRISEDSSIKYRIEDLDREIESIKNNNNPLQAFIGKNKEYEQSKEIIEQWKKENNIQYDPEEVYSRGQGFYSSIGAYSNLELDLLFQNLLQHIQDNKKAGGEFTISAFTKPIDKRLKHIEGTGDRVRFVIYPKSEHIKWAAPTDVFSGSVWDAHEKVSKDKKSELLGVSFTKAPALRNINEVSPNLADIIDNLSHAHNELGIELTTNNFRIEYDDNIDYSTKKLIDNINKILDDKHGKLEKVEIKNKHFQESTKEEFEDAKSKGRIIKPSREKEGYGKSEQVEYNGVLYDRVDNIIDSIYYVKSEAKQPTQTKENTTSIESVKSKFDAQQADFVDILPTEQIVGKESENGYMLVDYSGSFNKDERFNKVYTWEEANDVLKDLHNKLPKKEYTQQAETNLKIAALKEVARKYPRSLITSKVVPINPNMVYNSEIQYSKVSSNQNVNYQLKAVDILSSDKAKQVFEKGKKNGWSLEKILAELAVPREQRELIKGLGKTNLNEIVTDLLANYSYTIEINTAKTNPISRNGIIGGNFTYNDNYYSKFEDAIEENKWHYRKNNIKISKEEYDKAAKDLNPVYNRENTQHYSNLTVPGGTNYTENEIATPTITPSIKGHAQFSTNKGIGWFRSDDKINTRYINRKSNKNEFITNFTLNGNAYREEDNDIIIYYKDNDKISLKEFEKAKEDYRFNKENITNKEDLFLVKDLKTRRILEVQSDLFQKGRDESNLTNIEDERLDVLNILIPLEKELIDYVNSQESYYYGTNKSLISATYSKTFSGERIDVKLQGEKGINSKTLWLNRREEEYQQYVLPKPIVDKIQIQIPNIKNQFLQLLNKDNNWVTFFVKSIIQDSAKKGYKKVLFPSGNTASKVEGHSTLEEFKKQKEDRIKFLEEEIVKLDNSSFNQIRDKFYYDWEYGNDGETAFNEPTQEQVNDFITKKIETHSKEIYQLKQELERVEREGFGALKPIYNFYENTVTNILKKQGFNPELITDEYGNTWNEVELNESHLDVIHFQKAQGVQSFDEQTAKEVASVLQEVYPEISLEYTELQGLRGQANIKAGKVLIDSLNQNTDTLAHEYAHHYISWFKNSSIVQKGIRLFGSEEALVQAIGEQAVAQKAKANIWYKQFWNWIKSLFNDKQAQLERLTDSFIEKKTLGEKQVRNVTHNQAVDPNSIKSDEKLIKTIDAAKLVFKNRQAELKQQYGEERAGTRESIKRIRAALEKLTEQATYSDILSVAKAQLDVARNALSKPFNEMSDADFVDVKKILYFTNEFDKLLLNAPEDESFNRQITQVRAETIRLQDKFDKFIKQRLVEASKAYGREITPEELEKAYADLGGAKSMTMSLETTNIPHLQFAAAVMNWRSRQTDLEVNQFDREYRDLVKKYSEEEFKKIFDAKGHLISMYSHDFYNAQAEVYRKLRKLNDSSTKEDWMNAKREIGEWFEQNYTYQLTPEGKALFEKHLKEVEEANTFDGEVNQDAVEKFKQQYSWENKGVVNPDGSFTITKDGIPRSNIGGTNIYADKWYAYLVKTPLEKYKNPDFEKVKDLEVYNWYVDKVQEIYDKTSPTLTSELGMYDNVIHQTKLDLTESKFQLGNTLKGIKESALDWFTVSLTYHQLNETLPNLTDEKGRPKPLIRPKSLYEIQREGQFKNPVDLLRKGFEMAVTYEHKVEIQPLLELVGYQLEKTKKIEKNPITDKIRKDLNKNPLETAGMLTNAIEAFKFRENAELTGQTRTDDTSGIMRDVTEEEKEQLRKDYEEWYEGGKIGPEPVLKKHSWIKYSDAVVDFTRLNLIGLKPFSALANVSIGMINNYVYAAREKDFNTKDLDWAMIKLRNSMLKFGTANLLTNKEAMKIGSLALKFGVVKETFIEDSKEYGKNEYLKKIPQVLFLLQESGEYLIANQILLAKLHNTKIKNLAGKEKNLYEAFDEFGDWKTSEFGEAPEWNKLVHLNESGQNISKLTQFRDRIDVVRHRTQGDYNTPMPFKGKFYGRIFMLFRTWLPRAIEERFGSENKYLETKGRMLTLRDALTAKGLKGAGKFTLNTTLVTLAKLTNLPLIGEHIGKNPLASNAVESYEKYLKEIGLSDLDVENMRAQIAEFRMIILAVGLGMVFHALAGGGDDDPEVNFTVNLLQRVYQDLTFFIFPSSSFAIIKDPIPIMKTIMDGTEAINASINYITNPDKDTYKKGFRKGRSKTAKEWSDLFPVLSAWNSTEATYNQIFGENTYKYTKK